MKKYFVVLFLALCVFLSSTITQISTWEDLANIADSLANEYELVNDLNDMSDGYDDYAGQDANDGVGWIPISGEFTGELHGRGYAIEDVYSSLEESFGLFMQLGGIVDTLIIDNFDVTCGGNCGAIAATMIGGGAITKVTVQNSTLSGGSGTGGFVGEASGSSANTITYCKVLNCNIDGSYNTGGFLGKCDMTTQTTSISICYIDSNSDVDGYQSIGGIVGYAYDYCIIDNCYSQVSVGSSHDYAGGICGYLTYHGDIRRCYATGYITGDEYVGGLLGRNYSSDLDNCYATGNVTGCCASTRVGGLVGASETTNNCYRYSGATVQNEGGTNTIGTAETPLSDFYPSTHNVYDTGSYTWSSTIWNWNTSSLPDFEISTGWDGTICGVEAPAKVMGIDAEDISTIMGE